MFIRYVDEDQEIYRKAVTAYTSNIPIYVNGLDINQSSYPAINYRPSSNTPYYSYVPVASFSNVGATVAYDSNKNVINITTDYFNLKNQIQKFNQQIDYVNTSFNTGISSSDIEESNKIGGGIVEIGEVKSIDNVNHIMYIDTWKVQLDDSSMISNFSVGNKVNYFLVQPAVPLGPHGPASMSGEGRVFYVKATNGKWYSGFEND